MFSKGGKSIIHLIYDLADKGILLVCESFHRSYLSGWLRETIAAHSWATYASRYLGNLLSWFTIIENIDFSHSVWYRYISGACKTFLVSEFIFISTSSHNIFLVELYSLFPSKRNNSTHVLLIIFSILIWTWLRRHFLLHPLLVQ